MEIGKCRIGMKVRLKEGDVATIDELYSNGAVRALDGIGVVVRRWASDLTPVSDPCQECEMAATITSQCKQIADLQDACEQNGMLAIVYKQNAAYWRGELEKLQKEALAECDKLPLVEVAKCYKQVEPDQLLLSDDAKIVCELLRSSGPMTSYEISDRLQLLERCVIESLIEAREAGIVRLDDGKYSILRD